MSTLSSSLIIHLQEAVIKRLLVFISAVLLVTGAVYAWQYTASTSWNGSIHVTGTTTFTPGGTTAQLKMSAPDRSAYIECDQDQGVYDHYYTRAYLKKTAGGGSTYTQQRDNGGCVKGNVTLTTTETWDVSAILDITPCVDNVQQQSWGPVKAEVGNQLGDCMGASPGGR